MTILEALILGIVQGLTEFLPVSSSGHLVLVQKLFGIEGGVVFFNVAVHLATLFAVCIALWEEVLKLIKKPICKMTGLLAIATVPAVLVGLLLNDVFDNITASGATVGIGLLVTGAVLLVTIKLKPGKRNLDELKWHDALITGLAQAIAIVPGISRSGMTIVANLSLKMKKELAVKFAFLMSIPVILGGFILETYQMISDGSAGVEWLPIAIGMIAAGISGYFAIKLFIRTVMKGNLKWFAFYAFTIGLLVLIDQLFIGKFFDKLF
ncbi:MAG: undecaprenyl-diphosphate phosphatase [Clostridiales bacterium]|nr:undecaprenyl-diphosphate phosphatase [Clostridiales bacterium]